MMKTIRNCIALASPLVLIAPASACYSAKFENNSDYDLTVIWRAAGCAGIYKNQIEVCHHEDVKSGGSATYDYNWGTTAPIVIVRDPHKKSKRADWSEWQYVYHSGAFHLSGFKGTPPCEKHYTVNFDNAAHAKDIEY